MLETQEYVQAQDAEDSRQPEVKEKLHINMCVNVKCAEN